MTEIWRELLPINSIKITNTYLDEKYIDLLVDDLETGFIEPKDLEPVFVRLELGRGYFANDGNHRLSALKRVGVARVLADIYIRNE